MESRLPIWPPLPGRDLRETGAGLAVLRFWRKWKRYRVLGAVLVLVVVAATYFQIMAGQLNESLERTQSLLQALGQNRKLLGHVVDLEAGHRGYLLTGERRQLDSYEAASAALPQQLRELEQLLQQRPDLIRILAEMKELLLAKRMEMTAILLEFEREGRMAVLRSYGRDLGKYEMDSLRKGAQKIELAIEEMTARERGVSRRLMDKQSTAITVTLTLVGLFGAAAVLLGMRHLDALRAQERLNRELVRSQRKSDEKSTFLAHVSHEIRTPMNAIFGFSGLLQDRLQDPVNRRYIDAITSSARSLLGIINGLLDLAAIEAGKLSIVQRPTNLREVIDGVVSLFAEQARAKGIALETSLPTEAPAPVVVDADRLRQILINILGNAVKYTEQGSVRLSLTTFPGPERTLTCRIVVEDSGRGISQADLELIFEPFARGEAEGRGPGGSGLGLSITRQLARALGGEVTVESRQGRGSRFALELPGLAVVAGARGEAGHGLHLRDLPPFKALIVDDVELNRQVMQALFTGTHHHTRLAASARQALAVLTEWKPDLLLLDVRMPGMDGNDLARLLRARPATRDIALIAVTAAHLDRGDERSGPFDAVVLKPFTENALAREIAKVLRATPADEPLPEHPQPALAQALRQLLEPRWKEICGSLTITEVREFADELDTLGRRHGSPNICRYGQDLRAAAASFDVARIEVLLTGFPGKLAEVEKATGVEPAHAL